MPRQKPKIFLLYNPKGVVDKDIFLSAKASGFAMEYAPIHISTTPEGHTVERLDIVDTAKRIAAFKPDFVLTINGAGLDSNALFSSFCAGLRIPLVFWYVDEPFFIPEWGRKFIPEAIIGCTFDRYYEKRLREWGINHVFALPLGTNPERLMGAPSLKKEEHPYEHNISFVGSLEYDKIQYLLQNIFRTWNKMPLKMVEVLEKSIDVYRKTRPIDAEDVIHDCAGSMGVGYRFPDGIIKQSVLSFIDREASFRQRQEIIEAIIPQNISVFGEPFWEKIVGKQCYKGRINYYSPEIALLYKSSRINLNISKYQLKTTVNQRIFDCPICEGFLITDFREDIENYFEIDKSIVVYKDIEDLKNKIRFYLDHPKEARDVVENGKETVLERHTYKHRLEEIDSKVRAITSSSTFFTDCKEGLKKYRSPQLSRFLDVVLEGTRESNKQNPINCTDENPAFPNPLPNGKEPAWTLSGNDIRTEYEKLSTGKICYFCPDFPIPSAGTRRLYRHVHHLNESGFNAHIVHQKKGFILDWHGYQVPVLWIEDQPGFEKDDILVFPEGMSALMKHTKNFPCRRIAIALNWAYIYKNLPKGQNWLDYGISQAITPSPVIKDFLQWSMGMDVFLVGNYVDLKKYSYDPLKKSTKIAYMSRKDLSGEILRTIFEKKGNSLSAFQWTHLHEMTEDQYAEEINSSKVFLAASSQEGMPTSTLEAMASGCIVIGFSGVGGNDYMIGEGENQNCIIIENGNFPALGKKLEELILTLKDQPDAFEHIKENGIKTAMKFQDPEAEAKSLIEYYEGLIQTTGQKYQ